MTPNAAPQPSARPLFEALARDRRQSPAVFRGSLERRLPSTSLMAEAECLLPPVGRSEAFAEDLLEDAGVAAYDLAGAGVRRGPRLRWLGLPMLVVGAGATLSLASFSGFASLVGF